MNIRAEKEYAIDSLTESDDQAESVAGGGAESAFSRE